MNKKEILLKLIDHYTGGNKRQFAQMIGISPSGVSTWLLRNTYDMGVLVAKCEHINPSYLLTGEGPMLQSEVVKTEVNGESTIPLVHIDSVGGVFSPNSITDTPEYIERYIPFEDIRKGDVAIYQSGESMLPTIPSGAILHIREVAQWKEYFGYGNVFVLILTDGRRITKRVTKDVTDADNYVVCESFNEKYAPERLPKSMIAGVWKVLKVLVNVGW